MQRNCHQFFQNYGKNDPDTKSLEQTVQVRWRTVPSKQSWGEQSGGEQSQTKSPFLSPHRITISIPPLYHLCTTLPTVPPPHRLHSTPLPSLYHTTNRTTSTSSPFHPITISVPHYQPCHLHIISISLTKYEQLNKALKLTERYSLVFTKHGCVRVK